MAWLKYCEQRDLKAITTSTDNAQTTTTTTTPTATTTDPGDDWWNAWVPPETTQHQHDLQETHQTAVTARRDLNHELDLWRSKLYGDQPSHERAQQRRENFVRSAVTRAQLAERVGRKRPTKKSKHQLAALQHQKHEDFCLTDYTSDPERLEDDDTLLEDSDTDDDDTHKKASTLKRRSNGDHKSNPPPASQLLDGHRLDGSFRTTNHPTRAGATPAPPPSIAHVVPGSGVRKIVYAARTHSQLSQFVGELQRTAWGTTTRVVAFGSRQLLCGNQALKQAHPTESSLTEACLDLKRGTTSTSNKSATNPGGTVVTSKKRSQGSSSSTKKAGAGGCPWLESKEAVSTLGLHLLTTPSDIEDAARLGSASRTCAYYASRVRFFVVIPTVLCLFI